MKSNGIAVQPATIKQQVRQIIWLLFTATVVVLIIGYFQMQVMSAVRAYILGESLWAKGQRDAVSHLKEYIHQPTEESFAAYNQALKVSLSDREAREAMQLNPPDLDTAYRGLIGGGNHPDDISGLIRLFTWFQDIYPMKQAIEIWTEADREIENLQQLAERIRKAHIDSPQADLTEFRPHLDELSVLLNRLEVDFSSHLSEGARWLKSIFMLVNFCLLITAVLVIGFIARKVLSEIDETESELRMSESRFKALYDSNVIGIIIWGEGGELHDANDKFLDMLGYRRSDLIMGNINWREVTPDDWKSSDEYAMDQIARLGWCSPFHKEFFHQTGKRVPVFVGGAVINGFTDRGIAFVADRTNEKEMQAQLHLSATVLEASRDGILICDSQRTVLKANEAFYAMKGVTQEDIVGTTVGLFYADAQADNRAGNQSVEKMLNSKGYWQGDIDFPVSNGSTLPVRASISTVKGDRDRLDYYVAVYTDISSRKALENDLRVRAHYDHLTGLANRNLYSDRLNTAIKRAQRHGDQCALLFIDLDEFKPVNDEYGHAIGDYLLQQVAERIKEVSRKSDTVGRLGGDEFVVILEELDDGEPISTIAEKIIRTLNEPFNIQGHRLSIGCSIGAAIYPEHGGSGEALTRSADIAMYKAKACSESDFYFFTQSDSG